MTGVGHDDAVAHEAVVRDMYGRHQQAVVSDPRFLPFAGGAVDGRAFADFRAVADADVAFFAAGLHILRGFADGGEGKYLAVLADGRPSGDEGVRRDDGAVSDLDVRADDGKRADLHILADTRAGCDDSGFMYF